jgi:hypothetical protein
MENLIYVTFGISLAAFILAVINLYSIKAVREELAESVIQQAQSLKAVSDNLFDLRENFNEKVLEVLEELSGSSNGFKSLEDKLRKSESELRDACEKIRKVIIEDLASVDYVHRIDVDTKKRLFKLENPISSTTKFFYKENEVTVVKLSEGGFLLKSSDFKNKKLSEGEFYNLWFKGQLRKKNV